MTYEAGKAIDGVPDTAWRCDGSGVGQQLQVSFPGRVALTSIGMVPGYAKTDPYDGTDRYTQNRRISAVQYTFDDGSSPGGQPPFDKIAISEIAVSAR